MDIIQSTILKVGFIPVLTGHLYYFPTSHQSPTPNLYIKNKICVSQICPLLSTPTANLTGFTYILGTHSILLYWKHSDRCKNLNLVMPHTPTQPILNLFMSFLSLFFFCKCIMVKIYIDRKFAVLAISKCKVLVMYYKIKYFHTVQP